MMPILKPTIFFLFFFCGVLFADEPSPLEQEIKKMSEQFQADHGITGMAVIVIGRDQNQKFEQVVTLGSLSKKSSVPVNRFTEFRAGTLTQVFTAAALAYFVQEGQVTLNDPVSKFLPKSIKLPTYQDKEITLGDLATHTSGLPDMPYTLSSRATFSVGQMYHFLSKYELPRAPGAKYEYSNLGYAFLSNLLSRIAKRSFPDVLTQIVLHPLNLKDTVFTLSHDQKSRYAIGYEEGRGVSPLSSEKVYSVFIGAGGLISTPQNMVTWLSFNLGKEKTSLNQILSIMQRPYHSYKSFAVGLGWQISQLEGMTSNLFHNQGKLFGFSSYMGIIPETNTGVVILTNQGDFELTGFGEELLKKLNYL